MTILFYIFKYIGTNKIKIIKSEIIKIVTKFKKSFWTINFYNVAEDSYRIIF